MRVSFRVAILTLVLTLVGVTSGILVAFMFRKERQSIDHLKAIYLRELADTSAREAGRLPSLASDALQELAHLSAEGLLPHDHPPDLARIFAERLRTHPHLTWISYGSTNGRFVGATRAGTNIVLNFSDPAENGGVPREFVAGPDGTLHPFARDKPLSGAYDPRTRDWFRQAVQHPGRVLWLPPYPFAEGILGVTGALTDAPGPGYRGVFTADFSMAGISDYLGTLKVAENGFAVLIDGQGQLLASPAEARLNSSGRAFLETARGTQRVFPTNASSTLTLRRQPHDLLTRAVAPGTGLNWAALVVVPSSDFLGFVEANRRTTLLILTVGVFLALLLGALLSGSISRPLASVTRELSRVARFEFDDGVPARSQLKEIALVQSALQAMKASLRSFSRYAPEDIVREIALSGREASLSGERREVTLLFCDLRGFTQFSEKTSPEQVVALLNEHFDAMVSIVHRHHGYVCDFLGDSLFVVFGAPAASERHAQDAAACALEMQQTRQALDAAHRRSGQPELEMGIGLNTGSCVVGNMGSLRRIKYGVVGPSVNLASRIESFTVGGQILAADATRERLQDMLVAEGPFHVEGKGVGSRIAIWDVRGLRDQPEFQLPSPAGDLAELTPPLRVSIRRYHGKSLDAEAIEGVLPQMSDRGGRVRCAVPLEPFSSIQITLPLAQGASMTLDAKVRSQDGAEVLVSFTGIQAEMRRRLAQVAGR